MFGVILIYFTLDYFLDLNSVVEKTFQITLVGIWFLGIFSKIIGLGKIESNPGKIDGYITFSNEGILIRSSFYPMNEIQKIQISNDDYQGKLIHFTSGNFGPALSDGTRNFITVFFKTGKSNRYRYQLLRSDDFQKVRLELIEFCKMGKIDFWNLANVLGDKSAEEISNLTREINT